MSVYKYSRIKVIFLERGTTAGEALKYFWKVISLQISQLAHLHTSKSNDYDRALIST